MTDQYLLRMQGLKNGSIEKEVKIPAVKKISTKSLIRKVDDALLKKIRKEMFAQSDRCDIKSPVCTGKAQCLDHIQKTSPLNRLKRSNLQRACFACNLYKETHVQWANENGHSKSRFQK